MYLFSSFLQGGFSFHLKITFTTGGKCEWLENVSLLPWADRPSPPSAGPQNPCTKSRSKKCWFSLLLKVKFLLWNNFRKVGGGGVKNMENTENFNQFQSLGFLTTEISSLINQVSWRFLSWCQCIHRHLERSSRDLDSTSPFCQKLDQNLLHFQLVSSTRLALAIYILQKMCEFPEKGPGSSLCHRLTRWQCPALCLSYPAWRCHFSPLPKAGWDRAVDHCHLAEGQSR